jgi:serine/threonine-protein kinase RsbW
MPVRFSGWPLMSNVGTGELANSAAQLATVAERRFLARREFAGRPDQVRAARWWLSRMIDGLPVAPDVVLACSELASNAIIHSDSGLPGGKFTVRLSVETDIIRIEVIDQGGQWATSRSRWLGGSDDQGDDGQSGRGLTIVAALASSWGIGGDQEGRTAWCEIRAC